MARPKKEKELERNNRFTVRFTDAEMDVLRTAADTAGSTVSEYIREQAVRKTPTVSYNVNVSLSDLKPMAEELHKIGVNLNQIAYHLNRGGALTPQIENTVENRAAELYVLRQELLRYFGK